MRAELAKDDAIAAIAAIAIAIAEVRFVVFDAETAAIYRRLIPGA